MMKNSKAWGWGLLGALVFLGWFLTRDIGSPWTDLVDFNGAVWSQAAHNLLQAGLKTTAGVPAVFYFGPLPIPPNGFYGHHPALLHLELAGLFGLFGEHEWVARLLPITCSLASAVLLWLLVADCAGKRAATLAVAIFATLPMELHYGSMVNFEPCTLMWMLLGLLGLRHWEKTGSRRWGALMVAGFTLAMLTAWLGYFLVLVLCIHFAFVARTKRRGLALLLLGIAAVSGILFLLQIRQVGPEAWEDLAAAFNLRFGQKFSNGSGFTLEQWASRVGVSLLKHFPPLVLGLAIVGGIRVWRSRQSRNESGLQWLNWVALCFLLLNTFYVVVFRNASYIHEYASFYFVVPVAVLGGLALDGLAEWLERAKNEVAMRWSLAPVVALVVLSAWTGYHGANELRAQARVLGRTFPEPPTLVPTLGAEIQKEFPPKTRVLCNFATDYCPQLFFYSQRLLMNGMNRAVDWKNSMTRQNENLGGIIWMDGPHAREILALLPPDSKREVRISGIPFCFWNAQRERVAADVRRLQTAGCTQAKQSLLTSAATPRSQ